VPLFREWPKRLRSDSKITDLERDLAGPRLKRRAGRVDVIAHIKLLQKTVVPLWSEDVAFEVQLESAFRVLDMNERGLSHRPNATNDASGHTDRRAGLVTVIVKGRASRVGARYTRGIGIQSICTAQLAQLFNALLAQAVLTRP
jgi:hypothetical protein